ncbi:MAG TPA: FAD-binding dehydrogenase, partial [Eubacteriaceae bacterium]|nr:FAD-binding dehydrogenase [Eubacteriaceae bacterium]
MGTSPVPRGVSSPNRGAGLIEPLKAQAESAGVEIITETRATELITDDSNQVTGVKATSSDDEEVVYNAGAVVIASGGFDWNEDLRSEYAERAEGHTSFAAVGNEGDGLIMARDLGAEVISNGGV